MLSGSVPKPLNREDHLVLYRLDRVGSIASVTCAIHCAVMPVALTVLPAGLGATLGSEWIEWVLFACSTVIGAMSVWRGRRLHGRSTALIVCFAGLAMLALGRIGEERLWGSMGVGSVVIGGFIIASAHLINLRLCKSCAVCHPKSAIGEG